jgi:hypothetical protein
MFDFALFDQIDALSSRVASWLSVDVDVRLLESTWKVCSFRRVRPLTHTMQENRYKDPLPRIRVGDKKVFVLVWKVIFEFVSHHRVLHL